MSDTDSDADTDGDAGMGELATTDCGAFVPSAVVALGGVEGDPQAATTTAATAIASLGLNRLDPADRPR